MELMRQGWMAVKNERNGIMSRVPCVDCSAFPVLIKAGVNKCGMFRFSDGKTQPLAEPAVWMVDVKEEVQ